MNECKHEFFRMSEFGELFCDACCESQSKIVADMLVDSDTKLSEARSDALRMAQYYEELSGGTYRGYSIAAEKLMNEIILKYEEE